MPASRSAGRHARLASGSPEPRAAGRGRPAGSRRPAPWPGAATGSTTGNAPPPPSVNLGPRGAHGLCARRMCTVHRAPCTVHSAGTVRPRRIRRSVLARSAESRPACHVDCAGAGAGGAPLTPRGTGPRADPAALALALLLGSWPASFQAGLLRGTRADAVRDRGSRSGHRARALGWGLPRDPVPLRRALAAQRARRPGPKLDRVSSVSGGSITAGVLATRWTALRFEGDVAANLREQVVAPLRAFCHRTVDAPAIGLGALLPGRRAERPAPGGLRGAPLRGGHAPGAAGSPALRDQLDEPRRPG